MYWILDRRSARLFGGPNSHCRLEISWSLRNWKAGIGLYGWCPTQDESSTLWFGFVFVSFYITLPPWPHEDAINGWGYGFRIESEDVSAEWGGDNGKARDRGGQWTWRCRWPWTAWEHVRHDVLSEPETHSYSYVLRSGEVQNRQATIQVEEREWVRPWLPRRLVSRCIDVTFDDEVGERTGTWKGGTIGCAYNMVEDETAEACLRRMEREREFR